MNNPHEIDAVETPLSIGHLVKTLWAYLPVIALSMAAVGAGYAVCAILLYIMSPAQRTTVQPFRLEFRGAARGEMPNGVRFSPNEIITTPVLRRVFDANQLQRYTKFSAFSRSIFVLESNPAYEKLLYEYQARLSDPKLSPLDRDRVQKEFDAKRDAISKNDFVLSYAPTDTDNTPEMVVRKVLTDVLNNWANFAINEQHALDYRVAVLSPSILDQHEVSSDDPIIAIQILRSKIYRVIDNIEDISALPAAELARTNDQMTLAEIRMRLEDIVRFRLEPLVGVARASGLVRNPAVTMHFLESQLEYDQRRLQAAQAHANASRDALLMYSNETRPDMTGVLTSPRPAGAAKEGETVMPQLSDTFLDRIMSLSQQAADSDFRKRLVVDYRKATEEMVPLQQAVTYQQQLLSQMKGGAGGPTSNQEAVQAEIAASTAEVRSLITKVNDVYKSLSNNLNPSTQLFSVTGPAMSRVERSRTLSRLALYGLVVLLIALPVIVMLCLLHNRMREEQGEDQIVAAPVSS